MYQKLVQVHFDVLSALNNGEERSMLVGGCVREFVLSGVIERDVDISTTFLPQEVCGILKSRFKGYVYLSDRDADYGTIFFHYNGFEYEITTTREDMICDGRHAEVKFCKDFFVDSQRRDFSFNALYVDLNGCIHDFHNGLMDLRNREICFIGDAEKRIREDFLRIVRYYRFCAKMNARKNKGDVLTMQSNFEGLNFVSRERIRSEFAKMFMHKNWCYGLQNMIEDGLMEFLFGIKFEVNNDVEFGVNYKDIVLNLYHYFRDVSLVSIVIDKVVPTNDDKRLLLLLSKFEMFFKLKELSDELKFELYKSYYKERENLLLVVNFFDYGLKEDVIRFLNSVRELPINGNDVLAMGYKGVKVGEVIVKLTYVYIQSDFTLDKENLLKRI
jgi:poly(A) polymerase